MATEPVDSAFPHLKRWTRPVNYGGANWPAFFSSGFGRSRDSDVLERSNFETALEHLKGFDSDCPVCKGSGERNEANDPTYLPGISTSDQYKTCNGFGRTVIEVEENHWAVGWVAWIAIHESNVLALAKAEELRQHVENYPILDEDKFSEDEWTEASETWANFSIADRVSAIQRYGRGISVFAARRDSIPEDDSGSLFEYLARG